MNFAANIVIKHTFGTFNTEIVIRWVRWCWPTTVKYIARDIDILNSREGTWTKVSSQAEAEAGHRRTIRTALRSAGYHRVRHWSPSVRETIAITASQLEGSAESTSTHSRRHQLVRRAELSHRPQTAAIAICCRIRCIGLETIPHLGASFSCICNLILMLSDSIIYSNPFF
mgnify:FL=1